MTSMPDDGGSRGGDQSLICSNPRASRALSTAANSARSAAATDQRAIAFSPDNQSLAVSAGHSIDLFALPERKPQLSIETTEATTSLHFSLDGKCLDQLQYAPPFTGAYGWGP